MIDSRIETYKHIQAVQSFIHSAISSLMYRGEIHDQSKLQTPEVEVFDEYTSKLKDSTYGSDEYKLFLKEMAPALFHHYSVNRHHPEFYAYDREEKRIRSEWLKDGTAISQMSFLDLIEMLCDWKAATLRHADGNLLKSIEINQERFGYSDELKSILINTAKELGL